MTAERGWVLVSGGSGGIGRATARRLAERGFAPIVGYARNAALAETVASETGGRALPLDLADDAAIDAAVAGCAERADPPAGLILAASPPPVVAPLGKIADADMAAQWRINVTGPRRLLAGLAKSCFRKRRAGAVVGVLSAAMGGGHGRRTMPNMGAYVIAKHGLKGLLELAAAEYPWLKIQKVMPGFTETAMLEAFDPRFLDLMRAEAPDGRFATPEEVALGIVAELEG